MGIAVREWEEVGIDICGTVPTQHNSFSHESCYKICVDKSVPVDCKAIDQIESIDSYRLAIRDEQIELMGGISHV